MPNPKRSGRKMVTKKSQGKTQITRHRVFISFSSLNEIEDRNDLTFWNNVTRDAALKAINENKAMDIPVTLLENGWVVRKYKDGTVEKIKKLEKRTLTGQSYSLTKGSILHVKSN
jgi:hypothetical protein